MCPIEESHLHAAGGSFYVICPCDGTGIHTCLRSRVLRVRIPPRAPQYVRVTEFRHRYCAKNAGFTGSNPVADTIRPCDGILAYILVSETRF